MIHILPRYVHLRLAPRDKTFMTYFWDLYAAISPKMFAHCFRVPMRCLELFLLFCIIMSCHCGLTSAQFGFSVPKTWTNGKRSATSVTSQLMQQLQSETSCDFISVQQVLETLINLEVSLYYYPFVLNVRLHILNGCTSLYALWMLRTPLSCQMYTQHIDAIL